MSDRLPEELVRILVDPTDGQAVRPATGDELSAIRAAIERGAARRHDGSAPPDTFDDAFLRRDGRGAYLVMGGVASFLVEERLDLDAPVGAP
ncbi:MAG: hypothetical protein ACODAG_05685 [Myxococcota bacterium]